MEFGPGKEQLFIYWIGVCLKTVLIFFTKLNLKFPLFYSVIQKWKGWIDFSEVNSKYCNVNSKLREVNFKYWVLLDDSSLYLDYGGYVYITLCGNVTAAE